MSKTFEAALATVSVAWRQKGKSALVEAYSTKLMAWTIVARCEDTPELNGADIAALIVGAVNGNEKNEEVITELVGALETCLECDGKLDFSAEQEADAALRRAGERERTLKPGRAVRSRKFRSSRVERK